MKTITKKIAAFIDWLDDLLDNWQYEPQDMNNMNKEKAIERLDAIETEAKELREIIEAPERRKPEAGDVWSLEGGSDVIVGYERFVHLPYGTEARYPYAHDDILARGGAYLGKFNEVYVKISDVRDALSIKDCDGDDVTTWIRMNNSSFGRKSTLEALRNLNIIN